MILILCSAQALRLHSHPHMIPHPDKAHRGGEDAFALAQNMVIVADGVGGWKDQGIDPGFFSRDLVSQVKYSYQSTQSANLTQHAIYGHHQARSKYKGSATLLIILLSGERLDSYCIGDSGYMIIRQGQILFKSKQQQHSFNFPFQLSSLKQSDKVEDGLFYSHQVKPGDIVLAGSDGLFDNVPLQELLQLMNQQPEEKACQIMSQKAIDYGLMQDYMSPFAKEAKKQGLRYIGGKLDDTTCVLSKVILEKDEL